MIEELEVKNLGMKVIYDAKAKKRYSVTRIWDPHKDRAVIIMYNPVQVIPKPFAVGAATAAMTNSILTSDEFGSLEVVNLFASTGDKKNSLKPSQKVFERENLEYIRDAVANSQLVILAWGKGGQVVSEDPEFKTILREHAEKLRCIGLTTDKKRQPNYYYAPRREAKLKKCIVLEHGYDAIDI